MKATKKLIGALVALIASLAISVGATFAWFTSSNTAKITPFELQVKTETGNLFIGLSEETLTQGSITLGTSEIKSDFKLTDVTLDSSDHTLKKRANNEPAHPAEAKTAASAGDDYIQFRLYFKADKDMDIYLNSTSKVTCTANTANDITITDTTAQTKVNAGSYGTSVSGGKLAANAAYAVRVGFSTGTTIDTESDDFIWEPNADKGYHEGNLAADYEQYLKDSKWPESPNAKGGVDGNLTPGTSGVIISLTKDTAASVYVTIWLEGTDGDCLNSIFDDKVKFELNFAGKDKEAV